MNIIKKYILSAFIGILLGSIYLLAMPGGALAQNTSNAQIQIEVDSGCDWQGTPWNSELHVHDNDTCIITGTGKSTGGNRVWIEYDADGSGQAGGKLIVGGDVDTEFTIGGDFDADGIVKIGDDENFTNPNAFSELIVSGVMTIAENGDDGIVTITSNTNNSNDIDIDNVLNIGTNSNQYGTLSIEDNTTTNEAWDIEMYGTLNVISGSFSSENMIDIRGSGILDNDSILNSADDLRTWDNSSFDNSGTLNMTATAANIYAGYNSSGTVTFTNSGTINADNLNATITAYYDNIINNNGGTINAYDMNFAAAGGTQSATLNNGSSGDINISNNLTLNSQSAFNNNSGTTTVSGITYIHSNQSTKASRSTLTNASGASFESDQIDLGDLGGTYYGGNLNNDGILTIPTGAINGLNVRRGGTYTNQSNGTSSIVPNVEINGNSGTNEDSFFVNQNTTTDAVDIDGHLSLYDYSELNNSGSMRIDGSSNITIEANNADIINQNTGILNLNGFSGAGLEYDVLLTNEGEINIPNSSLTLEDSAQVDNGSTAVIDLGGTTNNLNLNNSSIVNNAGTIYIADDLLMYNTCTVTNDDSGSAALIELEGANNATDYSQLAMNGGTFNNKNGAQVEVDSSAEGITKIFNTALFENEGTFDTFQLRVGDGSDDGGTFKNQGTNGTVDINDTGNEAVYLYNGNIENNSTYGYQSGSEGASFHIVGEIKIWGTTGTSSEFLNNGVVYHEDRLFVYENGILDIDAERWVGDSYVYANNRGSSDDARIEIASGAKFSSYITYVGNFTGGDDGYLENYGEIRRINADGSPRYSAEPIYLYNDSNLINGGDIYTEDGHIQLADSSSVTNESTGQIIQEYSGDLYVHEKSNLINNGTIQSSSLYIGNNATRGGDFENNGSLEVEYYYRIHNGGIFINKPDATVDVSSVNLGNNGHGGSITNITDNGSGYSLVTSNSHDLTNGKKIAIYGTTNYNGVWTISDVTTNTFLINVDGYPDESSGNWKVMGSYKQAERSSSSLTKTISGGNIQINDYGIFESYDKIECGGIYTADEHSYYYQKAGSTPSNSHTVTDSSVIINGKLVIEEDTEFESNARVTFVNPTGELLNNGTYNTSGSSSQVNISVDGGIYRSSSNSSLNLNHDNPSMLVESGGIVEIAGTVNSNFALDLNGGDTCLGSWDTWPSPTDCINSGNSLTIGWVDANGGDIEIANNLTVAGNASGDDLNIASGSQMIQDSTSYIQLINDNNLITYLSGSSVTSNGHMDIQGSGSGSHGYLEAGRETQIDLNYTSADYDIGSIDVNKGGVLNVNDGTTLNLNDYHSTNYGDGVIAIDDNASTTGTATFNIYGTVNMNSGTSLPIFIGYDNTNYDTGALIVDSGGSIQHTNGSSGNVSVNETGRLEVVDDGNVDLDADFNGTLTIDGNYMDTNGDRGVYAGGQLECQTNLTVNSTGFMDVGANGDVTVAGSTTDVYGDVELDGTLNSGDLTVYSGGVISSGDGDPDVSGSGCGIGGNFGCGTTTTASNFYINATSVDVQSGGNISSDFVSDVDRTGTGGGGGSHGGEGVDISSSPTSTLGSTKATTPDYGERGEASGGTRSAYAGGGVNMNVAGDITINGVVSADGADGGTDGGGAGGTVIITHNPSATTAVFTGSGEITAYGGDGSYPGGGGRISIDSPLLDDPDFGSYDFGEATAGTVSAQGGNDGSSTYAATGTIVYLGDDHNTNDTLIIDQGGNSPSANSQTDLTDTPTFDRIEVNNSANADLTGATVATACYNISSTVTGTTTCDGTTDMPDKPDSLHIQTSSNGTSSGDATEEPGYIAGKGNGVSDTAYDVADLTPVFAMYFRNPGDTTTAHSVIEIQVDDNADFSSPVWDATFGGADGEITLNTAVTDGDWTEDIEYAGSTLSLNTTYYVRARFREGSGGAGYNPGLWTHADYNNQYKFIITSYTELFIDNCNGEAANTNVVLTQDGTTTGNDMSITSGGRYAYGACDLNFSTSESDWEVYLSMDSGETEFNHVTFPTQYEIDHIDNANNDCLLDTTGTGTEQEFGFNLTTYPSGTTGEQLADSNVTSNSDCRLDTATYPEACGNTGTEGYYNDTSCFFNVEPIATLDTILDTDAGTASSINDGRVTATFHANVGTMEVAGDYDVIVEATITANP